MVATLLERAAGTGALGDELAHLADRVRDSVALVRGSRNGAGSGVVWDARGLVITNHHVVPGGEAEVFLHNGAGLRARVLRRHAELDLAALVLEGDIAGARPVAAPIGDSDVLRPGQLVLAVGNPLGERNAVAIGMLSGAGALRWPGGRRDVLQVAIQLWPGNSGGALVDVEGRVVGIPHMVVGPGLALAIPSRAVLQFLGLSG
jgi:serine protease Do